MSSLSKNFLSKTLKIISGQNFRKRSEQGDFKLNGLHRDRPPASFINNLLAKETHFFLNELYFDALELTFEIALAAY